MIERNLRRWLRPVVNRRKKLLLLRRLAMYWSIAALIGIALITVNYLWGWYWPVANYALCLATVIASITAWYKLRKIEPDYKSIARTIEKQNPDLKATLLTAIEQEPEDPLEQLGYLQERVIGEAMAHARNHNWTQSISKKTLMLAGFSQIAALLFLMFVLSQLLPFSSYLPISTDSSIKGYQVSVSPGDTSVEAGTAVVITARFGGKLPQEVKLLIGQSAENIQEIQLKRNLEDPVFGGIIPEVNSDMYYHIEYANRRTREYKITTYNHPRLERADANIIYPSYTNLPDKTIKDTRQIGVIEGSKVTLTFTLNKSVDTARLSARDGSELDLNKDTEQPNIFKAFLEPVQSRQYELKLVDDQGRANKVPPRFVIDVHKNLPPELKTIFPNRDMEASPLEELTFEADVSDDYGVTAHGVSFTLAGIESKDVKLGDSVPQNQKKTMEYLLELEEMGARPDQLLTYYFWADDIGPDGNIRRTSTDLYFTEIRPFEEIFRENQSFRDQNNQEQTGNQQQGNRGEGLIQLQKQIISATWNIKRQVDQSENADEQKDDIKLVRQSQDDALQQARSARTEAEEPTEAQALEQASNYMETSLEHLTKAAETPSDTELTPALAAEQSAYQELLKLRERENEIALSRNAQRGNSSDSARSDQQLRQLELRQREDRYETQRLAQSEQQETQREDIQVLNRLRELARRQNQMADRLREAQAALRQARTEEQRQEISRELKRLRDEQIETLRDVDELQQRMDSPQNRQRMADAAEQLSESRSRIQQSAEEIERDMVSNAATSTTRAQRELEQMRDEFQRRTSGQFSEQMRNMREQAQQLDEQEKEIAEQIQQQAESVQRTLDDSGLNRETADRIERQRENLKELLDRMKDTSEQAENSEPLLSRRLYDTLRQASTENIDRALEATGEVLRLNFLPQAQGFEQQANQGIENLRDGVEEAAGSVLGDEAESLRLAREQIDELIEQVNQEAARADGMGREQPGDPNQTDNQQARTGTGDLSPEKASEDRQLESQNESPERQIARGGSRRTAGGERADPNGIEGLQGITEQWNRLDPNGPLTGGDFRQWSDGLRDVEEMLTEQQLREEVATVRDSARAIRAEFVRHGTKPEWDMVEMMITKPLTEVRARVEEKLAKLESREALVPIDRDPVPNRYSELVRGYYENLGGGD